MFAELTSMKESEAKAIQLHDDDPEAIVALLRYLYGVPYAAEQAKSSNASTLFPHALVYMTAEKYQVKALQTESCDVMSNVLGLEKYKEQHTIDRTDLLAALRTVLAGTPSSDTRARKLLVNHCVQHLRQHFKSGNFKELVAKLPELGAELIVHLFDAEGDIKTAKRLASKDGDGEVCKTCDRRFTNEEPTAIVVVFMLASTFAVMLLFERYGPTTWMLGVCYKAIKLFVEHW